MKKPLRKILFITDNFPPEVNAPATRTYEHCVEWVKEGVEVTVITCFPNFPKGEVYEGYKNKLVERSEIDGIKVIRVWSYITSNAGFLKRIIDFISFAFMAFWAGLFRKTDLIIATSPQFFTTWTGYALSVLKRKPWVFELRDIWPESIKAVGAISGDSAIYKILEKIELFLYRKASLVVSVTNSFKRNLVARGIDTNKIKVVRNGSNLQRFKPIPKDVELEKGLNLVGKRVIGYIGTHGMAHKLDFILDCWKKVDDNYHLLFIGDGAEKEKLVTKAEQDEIKGVTFLPSVLKDEVPKYLSIIDIALVPLKKSELFKTVIPSKIFENAAMGIPILLGVEGESKDLIESYEAGLAFAPENESDFIKKLQIFYQEESSIEKYKEGCNNLAQDFDRKKLASEMLEYLNHI